MIYLWGYFFIFCAALEWFSGNIGKMFGDLEWFAFYCEIGMGLVFVFLLNPKLMKDYRKESIVIP